MKSTGNQIAEAQKQIVLARAEILRLQARIKENEQFVRTAKTVS